MATCSVKDVELLVRTSVVVCIAGEFAWNCTPNVTGTESKTTFISIAQFRGLTCCRALQQFAKVSRRARLLKPAWPISLQRPMNRAINLRFRDSPVPHLEHGHFGNSGFYSGIRLCKRTGKTMTIAKPSASITRLHRNSPDILFHRVCPLSLPRLLFLSLFFFVFVFFFYF